ncbi:MAG: hypothetical protein ACK5OX_12070 [Desertimonas sp.]
MTAIVVVVIVVAVLAVVVVGWRVRRARRPDGVATFQRQIDALRPEARQRVVDEVQRIDDEKKGPPGGS